MTGFRLLVATIAVGITAGTLMEVHAGGGREEPEAITRTPAPTQVSDQNITAPRPAPDELPREFLDQNPPPGAHRSFQTDFSRATVDYGEIVSGGPPKDGIPSIDAPQFVSIENAREWLTPREAVLVVSRASETRIYPLQILMWHEIVNDTVAGVPVAVTYCPLCNSAVAYDRRVGDLVVDFGTSGSLWNSALVMYDRQTETLWSHFNGAGIVGELTGVELDTFPVQTVSWGLWRDANPDGLVLSRETGFSRDYGRNPYPGYDSVDSTPFLFEGEIDGTFTAMTRVVGIERGGDALGVPLFRLQEVRVVHASVAGDEIVVFWEPGTASALDSGAIAAGDDVGATGVFLTELDGERLAFTATDDGFVDDRTGSTWNLLGRAVDGPLDGSRLDRIEHLDTFWFAWAAFQPDSALVD